MEFKESKRRASLFNWGVDEAHLCAHIIISSYDRINSMFRSTYGPTYLQLQHYTGTGATVESAWLLITGQCERKNETSEQRLINRSDDKAAKGRNREDQELHAYRR